jgi:hypothetical protein
MVRKESARSKDQPELKSRANAIMQQHPEIKKMIEKLACQLAKCELSSSSTEIKQSFATKDQAKFCYKTTRCNCTSNCNGQQVNLEEGSVSIRFHSNV